MEGRLNLNQGTSKSLTIERLLKTVRAYELLNVKLEAIIKLRLLIVRMEDALKDNVMTFRVQKI